LNHVLLFLIICRATFRKLYVSNNKCCFKSDLKSSLLLEPFEFRKRLEQYMAVTKKNMLKSDLKFDLFCEALGITKRAPTPIWSVICCLHLSTWEKRLEKIWENHTNKFKCDLNQDLLFETYHLWRVVCKTIGDNKTSFKSDLKCDLFFEQFELIGN